MSQCVSNNADLLRALANMSPSRRKQFLKSADKELIQTICECALNTLKGNVPLKNCQKKTLSRFKLTLRNLIRRDCGWKKKRKLLQQKGGGLIPALLAPIIGSVLSNLVA